MNYVDKITTLSKEEATKSIIDALNSKAFDTLGNNEEHISELSKNTLGDYVKGASIDAAVNAKKADSKSYSNNAMLKRLTGITRAVDKLTYKETENGYKGAIGKFPATSKLTKDNVGIKDYYSKGKVVEDVESETV